MPSWSISTMLFGVVLYLLLSSVNSDVADEGLFRTETSSIGTQTHSNGFQLGNLFGVQNTANTVKTQHTNDYTSQYGHTNVLQNALKIVGVPITHTIATNFGSNGGGFRDTVNVGGVGVSAGINNADRGLGLSRTEQGGYVFQLGAISLGLGQGINGHVPGSDVSAVANGHGAHTDSETNTNSREQTLGLLSVSQSESQSTANAISDDGPASVSFYGYLPPNQQSGYNQQAQPVYESQQNYYSTYQPPQQYYHQHQQVHFSPQQQHYTHQQQIYNQQPQYQSFQQPQVHPQHQQTQQEYEEQYYKDYYNNFYNSHPNLVREQPTRAPQHQTIHKPQAVQPAPVKQAPVLSGLPGGQPGQNSVSSLPGGQPGKQSIHHDQPSALPGGQPGHSHIPVQQTQTIPSLPGGQPGPNSVPLRPEVPRLPGGQPGQNFESNEHPHILPSLPGGQPGKNIVPKQPEDTTKYQEHYDPNSLLHPSNYASDNYFEQPSKPSDSNYYIAPHKNNEQIIDQIFQSHPSTDLQTPLQPTRADPLDGILSNVFGSNEQSKNVSPNPAAPGKSLLDLLSEKPSEETHKVVNDDGGEAGGDYGLDVRSQKRRKRSLPETRRTKRKAYGEGHGHYVDEDDDDESNDETYFHHHHHNHGYGRLHNNRQGHRYGHDHSREYGHEHSHEHGHGHVHINGHREQGVHQGCGHSPNIIQPDVRPIHETVDEVVPLAPFPVLLPHSEGGSDILSSTPPPRDIDPVFNFDVRSNFGNETRRRRSIERSSRVKRQDSFVFGGDEDEAAPAESVTPEPAEALPAAPAAEEEEFEECELGEEDCEPASLDNRFGFATGMRRRRPFGGVFQGILQDVAGTLIGQPNQYQQYPQQRIPPPQYPHQQYPQQQYPHQQPPQPHYPRPDQQYQQQYPQTQYPQPQYPRPPPPPPHSPAPHHNNFQQPQQHFQQSADANTQSQSYQNEFGQFQQNGGASQSSNLAADGSAGQLSAANTQQQSFQNQFGSGNKNAAQSQSANFDNHGNLALNNANANTQHTQTAGGGHRDDANSGAHSTLQNQFGTSSSGAQSDTNTFNENGKRGSQSHGSSQSLFHGNDGSLSGSNSDATSGSFEGPFGVKGNQASSHSSSFNNGGVGGGNSVSASASSGSGGFGGGGGAQAQSGSFGGGGGSQANAGSNSYGQEYYEDLPVFGK